MGLAVKFIIFSGTHRNAAWIVSAIANSCNRARERGPGWLQQPQSPHESPLHRIGCRVAKPENAFSSVDLEVAVRVGWLPGVVGAAWALTTRAGESVQAMAGAAVFASLPVGLALALGWAGLWRLRFRGGS